MARSFIFLHETWQDLSMVSSWQDILRYACKRTNDHARPCKVFLLGRGNRLRIKPAEYPLAPFPSVSEALNPNESDCCSFSMEMDPLPQSVDEVVPENSGGELIGEKIWFLPIKKRKSRWILGGNLLKYFANHNIWIGIIQGYIMYFSQLTLYCYVFCWKQLVMLPAYDMYSAVGQIK